MRNNSATIASVDPLDMEIVNGELPSIAVLEVSGCVLLAGLLLLLAYCFGKKLHKTADGERLPVYVDQANYGTNLLSPCQMVTCPRTSSSSSIVLPHAPMDIEPAFTIKRKIRLKL